MRKLKLIWDFKGPDALKIAQHHTIHLKTFKEHCNENIYSIGYSDFNELYATAYIIVDEQNMKLFRDQLKPHRGEWLKE